MPNPQNKSAVSSADFAPLQPLYTELRDLTIRLSPAVCDKQLFLIKLLDRVPIRIGRILGEFLRPRQKLC